MGRSRSRSRRENSAVHTVQVAVGRGAAHADSRAHTVGTGVDSLGPSQRAMLEAGLNRSGQRGVHPDSRGV
jgi:hypothetical protein